MRRPKRALGETPRSVRREYLRRGKPQSVRIRRSLLPAPVLTYRGKAIWRLEKPYLYTHYKAVIQVPEGFLFDLASVPRILWWAIAPFELSVVAPMIHDFLYERGGMGIFTREEADQVFLEIMLGEGVAAWRRRIAYRAVRLFAGGAWRDSGG